MFKLKNMLAVGSKERKLFISVPADKVTTGGGRTRVELPDGLRLIFEDDKYVGFATQEPYVG